MSSLACSFLKSHRLEEWTARHAVAGNFDWLLLLLTGFVIDSLPPALVLSSHRTVLNDSRPDNACHRLQILKYKRRANSRIDADRFFVTCYFKGLCVHRHRPAMEAWKWLSPPVSVFTVNTFCRRFDGRTS
jgi:hypothetical protein